MSDPDDDTPWPHPRANPDLFGHDGAQRTLAEAWRSGRLAHAWLITGPRGIGKATLAFRFARFLLAEKHNGGDAAGGVFPGEVGPGALHVDPGSEVFRRIASAGHGALAVVERSPDAKTKKMRKAIVVDDVRRLHRFFGLTAAEGGWRVVIVDSADEMNRNAANALLKMLEEPPERAILLLVAHAPGRLTATIRSRCRRLRLRPLNGADAARVVTRHFADLGAGDTALIGELAVGSPGRALALAAHDGIAIHRDIEDLMGSLPAVDLVRVHDLADRLARDDDAYRLFVELIERRLAATIKEMAVSGATGPRGLRPWTAAWEQITRLVESAGALNLDRRLVILNIFTGLKDCRRGDGD